MLTPPLSHPLSSQAGIYVPTLAYAVYQYNQKSPAVPINLKGILVGNGCIGNAAGHCGNDPTGLSDYHDIQIWRGHGLISEVTYDACLKECEWANESPACQSNLQKAANEIGDIDVYYLYNTCPDPAITRRRNGAPIPQGSMLARVAAARQARGLPELGIDSNCYGTGPTLESWGNLAAVKAALHVSPDIDWAVCSNNNSFSYNSNIPDERTEIYPTLTQQAGYQVLIYNGASRGEGRQGSSSFICTARTRTLTNPPPFPPTLSLAPSLAPGRRGGPLRAIHRY